MKRCVSLVGFALLGFSSIRAEGVAVAAVQTSARNSPISTPTAVPPQQPDRNPMEDVLNSKGSYEESASWVFAGYYITGYAGQTAVPIATGGVTDVRTTTPPVQGAPQYANLPWTNGFLLEFAGTSAGDTGHGVGLWYSYMTGGKGPTNTVTGSLVPSFSTDNKGAFAVQSQASGRYALNWYQHGIISYSRSLLRTPVFSFKGFTAIHGIYLKHNTATTYIDALNKSTAFNLNESSYGAGPAVGVETTIHIGENLVLRGILFTSVPVIGNSLTQQDAFVEPGKATTYGLNASGTQTRQILTGLVDLSFVYRWVFENETALELAAGWITHQPMGVSRMLQATTGQAGSAANFSVNLGKVGFAFIW